MSTPDVDATPLRGISSMAMRNVLSAMMRCWQARGGTTFAVESVAGVVAARRVAAGEAFDVAIMAADPLDALAGDGHVDRSTITPLALSSTAVAVVAGAMRPDISSAAALRETLLAARSIGCSTGPSGEQLLQMFARWGLSTGLASRIVQAPPGVPVASLIARGEVTLGFQQLSELMHVPGVDIVGVVPADVLPPTVFSGAVCSTAQHASGARELLRYLASPACDEARRSNGMEAP
jgi:molybdate transport system substrate-binding protein